MIAILVGGIRAIVPRTVVIPLGQISHQLLPKRRLSEGDIIASMDRKTKGRTHISDEVFIELI